MCVCLRNNVCATWREPTFHPNIGRPICVYILLRLECVHTANVLCLCVVRLPPLPSLPSAPSLLRCTVVNQRTTTRQFLAYSCSLCVNWVYWRLGHKTHFWCCSVLNYWAISGRHVHICTVVRRASAWCVCVRIVSCDIRALLDDARLTLWCGIRMGLRVCIIYASYLIALFAQLRSKQEMHTW